MATPLTMARANSALKVLFPQSRVLEMDWENMAFYNWVGKKTDFTGRYAELPVRVGPHGGASNTFANAQAMKGAGTYVHFQVYRKKKYIMVSFDNEAIEAAEGDGGYMDLKENEIEGAFLGIKQQLAADFQGNGSGRIATIVSVNTGTNTIVVGEADIVHFQLGQRINSFAVDSYGATKTSAGPKGYMVVGGIATDTNTITLDVVNGDTILQDGADATTDKYLAIDGSVGNAIYGTKAWIPSDRSTLATPFLNVTRSQFDSRLAGVYYDGSATGSVAEALEKGTASAKKNGSDIEVAWVNFNRFQDLSLDLGARAVREPYKVGNFAYSSISFVTGNKTIKVMADPNFADDDCLIAKKSAWRFHSLKAAPRILGRQGNSEMLLEVAADGWEVRIGLYGELECLEPVNNVRIKLPT